jgi:hypothetical protein
MALDEAIYSWPNTLMNADLTQDQCGQRNQKSYVSQDIAKEGDRYSTQEVSFHLGQNCQGHPA